MSKVFNAKYWQVPRWISMAVAVDSKGHPPLGSLFSSSQLPHIGDGVWQH